MKRQHGGNDAETCAETWDAIHPRFTGGPGMSSAVARGIYPRLVSSTIETVVRFQCCIAGREWHLLLNAVMSVASLKRV